MPQSPKTLQQQINAAFIRELEAFKRGGYQFNGSGKELFEGTQREAFDAYLTGVKNNHFEGYFEIPTGVGKTVLFIAIIDCYLRATENIPDAPRVLIHEPTNDLVTQTAREFANFMPEIAKIMETDDERGREIDWKNSQIDIHFTGRNGAKNKPKVLITTYQGQAADERKSADKKIHKPADFGFVIHDEAHYLTGPKYGPAAVDKFHGAIQLGVTATPEYSDDKTVANKLKYRYYHLPLNTAIEREDLCHLRPVLIKTTAETKINLQKAKEFLEHQQGRPFSNAQLEQLLNQEARNKAIIKAYLTGEHPDTGERFLGQTGMIFAGGITHCNDFIMHTERVLNQPAYRDVKRWLRDEDLALIAPIHSKVPKDGVDVTIGGKKRKCTKEEIKELHRQGKILLIISDQELKLGSDFPMDSFIAETVDRFSVPDATQRMGRGFRVDRPNPYYYHPGNPNKSCAAINVIDETTHEMYKGTPHHPIHAIEILHGAEHRPPARRKGFLTRFKEQPPRISETLEELGFEFITRTEVIRGVAKKFEENKKKKLPEKTDEWLSLADISEKPGANRAPVIVALKSVVSAYDEQRLGEQRVKYNGQSIRVQKLQSGSTQPICIHHDDWPKVEQAAGVSAGVKLPKKTEDWLSPNNIIEIPGGMRAPVEAAAKAIIEAYDEDRLGEQQLNYNGQSIRVQKLQSGSTQPICIHHDDWPKVERAAGVITGGRLPEKTEEWLSSKDISKIPGSRRAPVEAAVKAIIGVYDEKRLGKQRMKYNSQSIRVQKLQAGVQQPICIHRDDWAKVERAAGVITGGRLPEKTDKWLASTDISKIPGGTRASVDAAVKSIIGAYDEKRLGEQQAEYNGQSIRVQKLQSRAMQPVCIYREDWPKVEKAAGVSAGVTLPEKTEKWLSLWDIKEMPGSGRTPVKAAVQSIVEAYDEERLGEQQVKYNGQSIRVQKLQSGVNRPVCIHRDDWPKVEQAAGVGARVTLAEKTEKWLSPTDIINKMPGGKRVLVKAAVKAIIAAYDEDRLDEQRVQYNGQSIRVQKLQSGSSHQTVCIHRDDWPKVEKAVSAKSSSSAKGLPKHPHKWEGSFVERLNAPLDDMEPDHWRGR